MYNPWTFPGGEYKYLPYKIPRAPHCEFINTDKLFYPDFASNSDYPQPGNVPCPFPAVRVYSRTFSFNLNKFLYRATILFAVQCST